MGGAYPTGRARFRWNAVADDGVSRAIGLAFRAMHRTSVLLLVLAVAGLAACNPAPSSQPSAPVVAERERGRIARPCPRRPRRPPLPPPGLRRASRRGLELEPVVDGLSDPVDIAWRPDDPEALFVVEQVGRVRIVRDGRAGRTAVPRHHRPRPRRRRDGPAGAGVPAERRGGPVLRLLHGRRRPPGRRLVRHRPRRPRRRRARHRDDLAADGRSVRQPQRRRARRSGRTATCTSGPVTAAAAATRSTRAGTSTPCWPRSCASTSMQDLPDDAEPRYAVPPDNPFVDHRRRAAGDLADRPAQSVADPLRPGDRRPVDRRRRPGRAARRSTWRAPASAGWTTAGTSWRARPASATPATTA